MHAGERTLPTPYAPYIRVAFTHGIQRGGAAVKNRYRLNGSTDMYGKRRERARASEHPRRPVERGLERKSIRGNPLSRRIFSRLVPRRHRRRRRACATFTYIDLSPSLFSSQTPGSPERLLAHVSIFSRCRLCDPYAFTRRRDLDLCLLTR